MTKFLHRANTIEELKFAQSNNWGVELDIRTRLGELIVAHDPNTSGIYLKDYVQSLTSTCTALLNVKESNIIPLIYEVIKPAPNIILFDLIVPDALRATELGYQVLSRRSEYESICIPKEVGKWNDFLKPENIWGLFQGVTVSPELHGIELTSEVIAQYKKANCAAICTKYPERW